MDIIHLFASKCLHAGCFPLDAIKMLIETKATPLFSDGASTASCLSGHSLLAECVCIDGEA